MKLDLFDDLLDVFSIVAAGLKAIANFAKNERDKYRQTMDETYRLLVTALNIVIIRLDSIIQLTDEKELKAEYTRLS